MVDNIECIPVPLDDAVWSHARALRMKHECRGENCVFNKSFPGQRAKYQKSNGYCIWCMPSLLEQALSTAAGRRRVSSSWQSFYVCTNYNVLRKALAAVPSCEMRQKLLWQAFRVPQVLHSTSLLKSVIKSRKHKQKLVLHLRRLRTRNPALYEYAMGSAQSFERHALPKVHTSSRLLEGLRQDVERASEIATKTWTCDNIGYPAPQIEDRPIQLRSLSPSVVDALRPLCADPGPLQRASQCYRVHTFRLLWSPVCVKEKNRRFGSHRDRKKARRARLIVKASIGRPSSTTRLGRLNLILQRLIIKRFQ